MWQSAASLVEHSPASFCSIFASPDSHDAAGTFVTEMGIAQVGLWTLEPCGPCGRCGLTACSRPWPKLLRCCALVALLATWRSQAASLAVRISCANGGLGRELAFEEVQIMLVLAVHWLLQVARLVQTSCAGRSPSVAVHRKPASRRLDLGVGPATVGPLVSLLPGSGSRSGAWPCREESRGSGPNMKISLISLQICSWRSLPSSTPFWRASKLLPGCYPQSPCGLAVLCICHPPRCANSWPM